MSRRSLRLRVARAYTTRIYNVASASRAGRTGRMAGKPTSGKWSGSPLPQLFWSHNVLPGAARLLSPAAPSELLLRSPSMLVTPPCVDATDHRPNLLGVQAQMPDRDQQETGAAFPAVPSWLACSLSDAYGGAAQECPTCLRMATTSMVMPIPPSGGPERHGWSR